IVDGTAVAAGRDLPDMLDAGADADIVERFRHRYRGCDADIDGAPPVARSPAQFVAHRGDLYRIRLAGKQGDPQTAVAAVGDHVAARRFGAIDEQRRGDITGRAAADAVEIPQIRQQVGERGLLVARRLALDVAAALHRMDREFA